MTYQCSCGMLIFDSPRARQRHNKICRTLHPRITRRTVQRCRECKQGQHLLCDGGDCHCTCARNLDRIYYPPGCDLEWEDVAPRLAAAEDRTFSIRADAVREALSEM